LRVFADKDINGLAAFEQLGDQEAADESSSNLYGPGDFSRREADLARVVPLMVRVLPAGVIATVSQAVELSILAHELDRALVEHLPPRKVLSVATYCDAYCALANRDARERQVSLIVAVGVALDRYVGKPMVRAALAAMRQPARLAGLAALQSFLERGFAAFGHMGGASEFLHTIQTRETTLMNAIFSGDRAPFPSHEQLRVPKQRVHLPLDLTFDRPFERGQQKGQLYVEANIALADMHVAGQAGALE
jgi:hypothetical protein